MPAAGHADETSVQLYLVRHAQSEWQVARNSDLDSGLTRLGHRQAERMGDWLARGAGRHAQRRVASLCCSPLRRARDTAAYASEALDLPLVSNDSLREAPFHVADHLPRSVDPLAPSAPATVSATYAEFSMQASYALRDLLEMARTHGGPVLAVAHGGLLKTLLRRVVGSENVCFQIYNTGLVVLEWTDGRWYLVHLNLCEHLPEELRTH